MAANGSTVWSTTNDVADPVASGGAIASGSFSHQIAKNGMPTGYWVTGAARTWNQGGSPSSSCVIFEGNPYMGGVAVQDAPYQCVTTIAPAGANGIVQANYTISPAMAAVTPVTPPAQITPANPTAPSTSHAVGLANTGTSIDGTPYLAGILALLFGVGLMFSDGRRTARGRTRRG